MREKSLIQNYVFNLIKTFSSLLFPVITFTYSARILGESGIGRVNFAKSIVTCFTMFAMLGMNYYGMREAAKLRHDQERLSKFSEEMLMINVLTTLVTYSAFLVMLFVVPQVRNYRSLLILSSLAIPLQSLGMEWLYQALEEYRYIALRTVLFQLIALFMMFLLVKDANDEIAYAALILLASSGSYVMNFINTRKYIVRRKGRHYEFRRHLKPLLWLFAMAVSIELYTVLDSVMLGFLQGDVAVGRYTAAVKINKLVISLITTVGYVLIPRMSYYLGSGEKRKAEELIVTSYHYVFMLSIPAMVGLFVLSDEIIWIFSGKGFAPAGPTMRILTPIVLLIPFSTITNQQTFVPMGEEKLILVSTCVGAVTNFTCNLILIPLYSENGAAIATVIAELTVAAVCLYNISRFYDIRQLRKGVCQYVVAAIPIPIIAFAFHILQRGVIFSWFLTIMAAVSCYFFILFVLRNTLLLRILGELKNKMHGKEGNHCGKHSSKKK